MSALGRPASTHDCRRLARWSCRWLVVVVVLLGVATAVGAADSVDVDTGDLDGSGTTTDPYEISNASELQALEDDLSANYTLASDINASETDSWDSGRGFDPIGTCEYDTTREICTADPFDGSFDGAGYSISNLSVDRTAKEVGLFGGTDGATVEQVRLTNVSIESNVTPTNSVDDTNTGGLVGFNNGAVDSVFVSGTVGGEAVATGTEYSAAFVGGVAGGNNGSLTDSVAAVEINGTSSHQTDAGGVVGSNDGSVDRSVAAGNVTADSGLDHTNGRVNAGGVVGQNTNRTENAYATGDVDGDNDGTTRVGGAVGWNSGGLLAATYATGQITATGSTIDRGGLVGEDLGTVTDSYFDTTPDNGIGTQLSTADMQGSSPLTTMTGLWDSTVWETVEAGDSDATADGYPILSAVERQRQLEQQELNARTSVRNWDDLDAVRTDLDGSYLLADDLDDGVLGYDDVAATSANGGNGFDPIGSFNGTFDGRNRTIGNLTVDRATDKVGLFGSTQSSAMVEYVHLDPVSVAGNDDTGGLVGDHDGTVRYSTVDGTVNGSDRVGGIVGYSKGTVNHSEATVTINGSTNVGGLVGYLDQGEITASTASGNINGTGVSVRGNTNAGGLVGYLYQGELRTSNASGSVNGTGDIVGGLVGYLYQGELRTSNASGSVNSTGANVGGLVGQSYDSTITGSNARGDVNGTTNTGGLVGGAFGGKRIENSSATGAVNGSVEVGGLVGVAGNNVDINRSYTTGAVDGTSSVGGLIGFSYSDSEFSELYATGSVNGSSDVGGLIGWNDGPSSRVERSYAAGTVTATSGYAGGLVGDNDGPLVNTSAHGTVTGDTVGGLVGHNEGNVSNSLATGTVDDTATTTGGLVADNSSLSGTVRNAYWDVNTTNQSTSEGGTGLPTANLTGQSVSDLAGLNETSVWTLTDSYPVLRWRVEDLGLTLADTSLDVGESTSATVSLALAGGSSETASATSDYSSDDTSVATVDAGTVTADGEGTVTVTAKAAGDVDTAQLSVSDPSSGGSPGGGPAGGPVAPSPTVDENGTNAESDNTTDPRLPASDGGSTVAVENVVANESTLVRTEDGSPLSQSGLVCVDSLRLTTTTDEPFTVSVTTSESPTDGVDSLSSAVDDTVPVGYLTVDHTLDAESVATGVVSFCIVDGAELDDGEVTLYRYAGGSWQPLDTTRVDTDGSTAYYEAVTPGFSTFAVGVDTEQSIVDGSTPRESVGTDETGPDHIPVVVTVVAVCLLVVGLAVRQRLDRQSARTEPLD